MRKQSEYPNHMWKIDMEIYDRMKLVMQMATHFANGRVTALRGYFGEVFDPASPTWKPRVSGQYVRNAGDPPNGFPTKAEALGAARKYRDGCRQFISKSKGL